MANSVHPLRRRRRRILPAFAAALVALPVAGGLIPTSIGGADPAGAQAVPAGSAGVIRYFGKGAYEGIRAAVAATPRSCGLSDDELTALVMAPIFKEVSMADTPESAPSPMTLSRWDEWSGTWSGSDNLNANYGLYAFRDPVSTPYKRAYWTPGVGIFQYDVAGVGAPYTAAEMMDVKYIAGDVAAGMATRYCGAGGDAFTNRSAAWQPWQALDGIAKSEALFQEMVGAGHPPFSTIGLVDGIDNAGGMEMRTCLVGGAETECAYVNPAAAQGANWWATSNLDGGTVGSGEAPLTAPFYVVERNGYEERHWKAQDTGYDVDISARRLIGQNARPMDGQPQSGLEWIAGSDLCDTERPEMGCTPPPPPPEPAAEEESEAQPAGTTDNGAEVWATLAEVLAEIEAAAESPPAAPDGEAAATTRQEDDAPSGEEAAAATSAFSAAIPLLAPAAA
jgi:hypothetical protein